MQSGTPAWASLADAWTHLHEEPEPGTDDGEVADRAFTFPCDSPSKRIDVVAYAPACGRAGQERVCAAAVGAELVGRGFIEVRATACSGCFSALTACPLLSQGTKVSSSWDGMLSATSPQWPSDHRGVLATIGLQGGGE